VSLHAITTQIIIGELVDVDRRYVDAWSLPAAPPGIAHRVPIKEVLRVRVFADDGPEKRDLRSLTDTRAASALRIGTTSGKANADRPRRRQRFDA
jgi:hypothetical protein